MATTLEYAEFVCEQLDGIGSISMKKMFGEYCIYINEKPIILCCDNTTYIAKDPAIEDLMKDAECGVPYKGAKERYILDIDHRTEARQIVKVLESVTPFPKPKKPKSKQAKKG